MRTTRQLSSAAAGALAALALGAAPAAAQDTSTGVQPYRFTVEGYLAQYSLDTGIGDRQGQGGYGVRLMFNRSTPSAVARSFLDRATAGVYGTFTTQDNVSSQNVGVQVDASLFNAPLGVIDPFISLGAGAFRTSVETTAGDVSETNFVLTPAAGTRIPFFSGIGFRGDLRAPIVFGDDTRVQFLAEGGIYISF